MKLRFSFCVPFQLKRFFRFAWISLFITSFCFPAFAFVNSDNDIQDLKESRQLIKQAEKLIRKGSFSEAEDVLRRIITQNPQDSKAKLNLSYVLLKGQRAVEAYDTALAVATAEPKSARARALVGLALLNFGDFRNARKLLESAYQLDKDEALSWFGAGLLDFYENRIFDSVPKLQQAEYLEPNEPDFVFSLAQVLARAEKYKEAGDAYERFLQISPISDAERRARIRGLINFLRYLGNKQKLYVAGGSDVQQSTVPIDLVNLRPIIEVEIDGNKKEKFRFVLDTGSGMSVISDKLAQRLKIKTVARGGMARAVGGDGKFEIVYGFLKSIGIGETKIQNVPVYMRKFHDEGGNIDGYIGLALISKFLTTVDYGNLTFTLTKKDEAAVQKFENETIALPLRLTSSGFLSGEVMIDGIETPLNFIVDTGASVSVISEALAKTNQMSRFLTDQKMRVIGAAGITENVDSFVIPHVKFGEHSGKGIKAVALNLDIINEASGFQQSGILGGNFLKNYRLTFDFQNSRVTFVPNAK
jgi:Flp pilus assembly protein TadD/predicted aspartyl protease